MRTDKICMSVDSIQILTIYDFRVRVVSGVKRVGARSVNTAVLARQALVHPLVPWKGVETL